MSEYTPGPWKAERIIHGGWVIGAYDPEHEDDGILRLADTVDGGPEANAHLIASAPELLESLKECSYWLRERTGPSDGTLELLARAYDAIAKAEGRSE